MSSKFFDEIKCAKKEEEVAFVYNKEISFYFLNDNISFLEHPYGCDGSFIKGMLRLLVEYKHDVELKNTVSRAKVLVQVLYYLKRFELNGERLPNVIMVGDINEVFVMHVNFLDKYLDEDIDWNIAPSSAHESNLDLVNKIAHDDNINPYVWTVDENFSFKEVAEKIKELALHIKRHVRITEHNISRIFEYFTKNIIIKSDKIEPNDLVGIFISSITDKINCYKHPNNPNILVANGKNIQINGKIYDSFFSHFEKEYSPEENNNFTAISDRLIEDTKRRRSGEFYTPTLFADYAHKMLSEELGADWKDKYVVWDCCWGTGNLTRDYQFKELYASTLEQAELDCGKRYNPEATKFIFDFLNDDITNLFGCKLPSRLYEALDNDKPIVFFINPPYATAGVQGAENKKGCALTRINKKMASDNIGKCRENIYAQFLYRICLIKQHFKLHNCVLALFCNPNYLSGDSYREFRNVFLNEFEYKEGILFNAGNFSGVADTWGINFTIWITGKTPEKTSFLHNLVDTDAMQNIIKIGKKNIYNLDEGMLASEWVRLPVKHEPLFDMPPLSNGITLKNCKCKGKMAKDSLGYFYNNSNRVSQNSSYVGLFTSSFSDGHGLTITKDNYENCITLYSARKLITNNWINHIDEYLAPDIKNEKWQEFLNDSIVFSLFESKSQQSSLRNIYFEDKNWHIKNEFFFMSKNEIMILANENNFNYTYNDARVSEERFVYKKLQEIELSKEAQNVLNKAIELTKKSFKYREMFDQEHPEYQIMNWDSGWYQIKAVLKEYFAEDLKEFQDLYKVLADKMRPMVYELGFLK